MQPFNLFRIILISLFFSWHAQTTQPEDALQLRLRRSFGYSSGSGAIQGTFTLNATGPDDLVKVEFYLDGGSLGEDVTAPFQLRFVTDDYELGDHTFQASGSTSSGTELHSNEIQVRFVTAAEGWQAGLRIVVPLLVIVGGAILLSTVVPLLFTRGKRVDLPSGTPRSYGFFGGAICPKCKRPFGLHIYGLNVLAGKLDRCPYCGKWSVVRSSGKNELDAAEAAELTTDQGNRFQPDIDSEEQLRREADESRFSDL
jgi:hypothetical protein